jgi:epsilon-lactone hydrolase
LVEAVPMAATMGIEVIAVDYRMAPEFVFPAASEDVAQVYAELLKTYDASSIGIYGCSAGGILTAQATAWMIHKRMPLPGAIAMTGGSGIETDGDSVWTAPILNGERKPSYVSESDVGPLRLGAVPYLAGAHPTDPLAFPATSSEMLARFPPSLLLTASRDFAASSLTMLHRRLVAAGVDARLFVFDGLWHAFQIFPELPESEELHRLLAAFFDRTLTRGSNRSVVETS